jgi:hypothetical protein
LRTDRRARRPSFCGTGLLAQPEATGRSRCLAKSSLVTQRWRYLLCHSGKLRTVVGAASTTKDSFIETRKGEQMGRVENRRSGVSLPVAHNGAFARVASVRFGVALFPVPAHRTEQARFAHSALGESVTRSPTEG